MTEFEKLKEKVRNNTRIQLSPCGYINRSDYAVYTKEKNFNVEREIIENIKEGGLIFVHPNIKNLMNCINEIVDILLKRNIKINWYIIWEPSASSEFIKKIKPVAKDIFLTNNTYKDENIHSLPLGIRDGFETDPDCEGFTQKYILDEKKRICEKEYLCLLCFSNTSLERYHCQNILGNSDFIINLNKIPFPVPEKTLCGKVPLSINYYATHKSKYVLSPAGLGEATHRFYEALYLDAIPIVKRTNNQIDKLYEQFPCLIVNDWDEVTKELLEKKYESLKENLIKFNKEHPNWIQNISCLDEILLKT